VRLIAALGIAGCVSAIALAALPEPRWGVIVRVRAALGPRRDGWRNAMRTLPLLNRWQPLEPDVLRLAGFVDVASSEVAILKVLCAVLAAILTAVAGAPTFLIAAVAYAGFIAPTLWIEQRAHSRIRAARAAVLPLVERLAALTASGRPLEHAFVKAQDGAGPLAPLLRKVATLSALGVSPFEACADLAERERLNELRDLCRSLATARRGGRPLTPLLAERREVLRLAWRAERLDAASRVDGALSLVLILAYLPALLLLVVIPLFLGLLSALET
jgi:Flp pilus assembly protein TadB